MEDQTKVWYVRMPGLFQATLKVPNPEHEMNSISPNPEFRIAIVSQYNRDTELNTEFRIGRASPYGTEQGTSKSHSLLKFLQLKSAFSILG